MASSDPSYATDAAEPVTDWQDYSNYYDEYDDDEEVRFSGACACPFKPLHLLVPLTVSGTFNALPR